MAEKTWGEKLDHLFALPLTFWDKFGLSLSARAASLFSLPIEGGFWSSVMGDTDFSLIAAYSLPFTLDLIADLLVYRFGRIQQTVKKGSKKWSASRLILIFVFFNAVQSWGTAAWQLNNSMNIRFILWPILFGLIQPMIGAGVSWTLAVQDGKFDEQERSKPKQGKPELELLVPEPEQPKVTLIQGKPSHDWWVEKLDSLNGKKEQMTPDFVRELIQTEYTDVPSSTTLYNWSKEAQRMNSS